MASDKNKTELSQEIVAIVNNHGPSSVTSVDVLLSYMTSLLLLNDLPPLYTTAGEILRRCKGCASETVFKELITSDANPVFYESLAALKVINFIIN